MPATGAARDLPLPITGIMATDDLTGSGDTITAAPAWPAAGVMAGTAINLLLAGDITMAITAIMAGRSLARGADFTATRLLAALPGTTARDTMAIMARGTTAVAITRGAAIGTLGTTLPATMPADRRATIRWPVGIATRDTRAAITATIAMATAIGTIGSDR